MPALNPMRIVDAILAQALRGHAVVLAVVGDASRIQIWDQVIDPVDMAKAGAIGPRVWIAPIKTPMQLGDSNSSARVSFWYRIGFAAGTQSIDDVRRMQLPIYNALGLLYQFKGPDGTDFNAGTIADPFILDNVEIADCDVEREVAGDGPLEWQTLCDVALHCRIALEDLAVV